MLLSVICVCMCVGRGWQGRGGVWAQFCYCIIISSVLADTCRASSKKRSQNRLSGIKRLKRTMLAKKQIVQEKHADSNYWTYFWSFFFCGFSPASFHHCFLYTEEPHNNDLSLKILLSKRICRYKVSQHVPVMINDKELFSPYLLQETYVCGYLLESPRRGDSNNYPQHMFLGVLNTAFLNISNYLLHLELRNRSIPIVVVTNFVVISSVGIKRFHCIFISSNEEFVILLD